jgi:hypothetical protein
VKSRENGLRAISRWSVSAEGFGRPGAFRVDKARSAPIEGAARLAR